MGPAVSHGKRGARLVARVSIKYLERCGPKDADVPFSAAAATGPEHPVDFKRRPFGILRYQSGQGGKGAMAMEVIPISRYPGDPQGFTAPIQTNSMMRSLFVFLTGLCLGALAEDLRKERACTEEGCAATGAMLPQTRAPSQG